MAISIDKSIDLWQSTGLQGLWQELCSSSFNLLTLEASSRGLVTHGMQGFDYEKCRIDLEIPDNFDVMSMVAIGKKGPKENLPSELQNKEFPNNRKPLNEIVMEGTFRK